MNQQEQLSANFANQVLQALERLRYSANRLASYEINDDLRICRKKNPLNDCGATVFSQNEEDGITHEILRRLDLLNHGTFAEFGVGNGFENNTAMLVGMKWRGFWVGGENLAFNTYSPNPNYKYTKTWITRENIVNLYQDGCEHLGISNVDALFLDLDGNDIHLVRELLKNGANPKLFVVEYHARFIPPMLFEIEYDEEHHWTGDDYYGASLATFAETLDKHDYSLVCCNERTGVNAFFIQREYLNRFNDVPRDILDLWMPPRYDRYIGHPAAHGRSAKVFELLFKNLSVAEFKKN